MPTLKESLLEQLDSVLAMYRGLPAFPLQAPEFHIAHSEYAYSAVAAVERAVDRESYRAQQARKAADDVLHSGRTDVMYTCSQELAGILVSIRNEIDAGYLESTLVLIHADMFTDMLERAEYLLSEGYKDPAAVMGGGVLESHLRNLCGKNGMPYALPDGRPKKASAMNDELAREKIYTSNQQKEVTSWLGMRNSAAHGKFAEFDANQVKNMLAGVRGFINRYPA